MGKNEPKPDNRRFHFQLDLPDESLPSSSGRSPSSSGKTKARPDPDRRPAHSAAPQAAARRSTASRQAAGSKAASARAARTDYERTNRANQRRPVSGYERTSAKRPMEHTRRRTQKNHLPKISAGIAAIGEAEGAGGKAAAVLALIVLLFLTARQWFRKELTLKKLQQYEKTPGSPGVLTKYGTFYFFPAAIFYLELVFHIYMRLGVKYVPIYLFFSIAAGFVCALLTSYFPEIINRILTYIITFLLGLIFCIEIVCKTVLAQYYQLASSASTAVNNHLTDYTGAIIDGILMNIIGLLLMFVPLIVLMIFFRKRIRFARKPFSLALLTVIGIAFFHILGLISLHLPYGGSLKPSELYKTDTEIEEQVRQLGMLTMLRLDIKHSIFGVDRNLSFDNSDLEKIDSLQGAAETETEAEAAVDTSPNVLDLDFEGLSASNSNESVQWLNQYFSSLTPTNKNEYTGMFKGYNVIFITAEGFSGYMIDEELTPTLYKLTHEGFVFNNFYTALHYTSTSGGECQNLLGLYPKNGEPRTMGVVGTSQLSMPFTLANQLNNLGYNSIGYHFNVNMYDRDTSHPQIGYDWNDSSTLTLEKNQYGNNIWPQSDNYMITETFDLYVDKQPFNIYYMTISGHMPYVDNGNSMAVRNYDAVADLPYSEDTKCYIAANLELEKGLTTLINNLEEAGIADKTLIVMAPDHIPYFDLPVLEELTGETFGESEDAQYLDESNMNFEVYKNSLIIWSASIEEPITVDKVCCQVDILPTVSNLLGLNYDSRLLEGSDIMSDSEGLVIFSSRSWKSDKGLYNRYTGEFTPAEGVTMTDDEINTYVEAMNTAVSYKLQATTLIQDTDYYSLILPDGAPYNEEDVIEPGSMETSSASSESSESSESGESAQSSESSESETSN